MAKRIHGEAQPTNVPSDMQAVAPEPCKFNVGDAVTYTNEYGASFERTVRGFAKETHGVGRFVYLDTDAWWFPVSPRELSIRATHAA